MPALLQRHGCRTCWLDRSDRTRKCRCLTFENEVQTGVVADGRDHINKQVPMGLTADGASMTQFYPPPRSPPASQRRHEPIPNKRERGVITNLEKIGWTKTQAPGVHWMNQVQMEKPTRHLIELKYWMVQMALAPTGTSKYAVPASSAVTSLRRRRLRSVAVEESDAGLGHDDGQRRGRRALRRAGCTWAGAMMVAEGGARVAQG